MIKSFIFGSINMDYVFALPYRPQIGETVKATSFQHLYGGKGANQALAISRLGGFPFLIGDVGDDEQGKQMIHSLNQQGVNTEGVSIHQGQNTGLACIYIHDRSNQIVVASGANQLFNQHHFIKILEKYARPKDILIVQFEKSEEDIAFAVHYAKKKEMIVFCNPSPMNVDLLKTIQNDVDYLIINQVEYEMLTHTTYSGKNESSFQNVIITLGEKGSHAYMNGVNYFQQAVPAFVVDTTGAGDTFLGAFVAQYGITSDVQFSLSFATKAASLKVSRWGAQDGIPFLDEVMPIEFL
jgi:ribokinase